MDLDLSIGDGLRLRTLVPGDAALLVEGHQWGKRGGRCACAARKLGLVHLAA